MQPQLLHHGFSLTNSKLSADQPLLEEKLTHQIIGASYTAYNTPRFGFVESVSRRALVHELILRGISLETEVPIDVWYKGVRVGHFRADHVAERKVLIESKTRTSCREADWRQFMNYLPTPQTSRSVRFCISQGGLPAVRLQHFEKA